jgi:anti-sigma factor RsiW
MNSIEEKLWNYIDGTCTAAERAAIDLLLAEDEAYQQTYLELLALNREIAGMELEEPSMAFTYKVMENIRTGYARQPLKTRINSNIIKVIGGFFIVTIAAMLILIVASINWSAVGQVSVPTVKMPDFAAISDSGIFKGFMFFDVVLLLFVLDRFLHKRVLAK